jgi:hypothetical protein
MQRSSAVRARIPFLATALIALVVGVWAGLQRMGWELKPQVPSLLIAHGPPMVGGLLGTVIGLERAVALRTRWGYLGPALSGLGVVALIGELPAISAAGLMAGGSLVLVVMSVAVFRRGVGIDTALLMAGAAAWLAGNLLWLTEQPLFRAVPWWSAFLVLTIVGERLDLSRLGRVPRAAGLMLRAAVLVYVAGVVMTLVAIDPGIRLAGLATVALALWLLRYDVARRTVRQPGAPRFVAVCILSGAVWLAVSGVLAMAFGDVRAGMRYDALLHTLFLGFVFALIFGHALIILPAVTGLSLGFHAAFYAHLGLLHASVLLRLVADLAGDLTLRRWSGLVSAVALTIFLINTAWGVWSGRRQARRLADDAAVATPALSGARNP